MLTCYISKLFIWFNTILPSSCKNSRNFFLNHKTEDFPIFHLWIYTNFKKLNFYGCNNVLYYSYHKHTRQMVPICSAVITHDWVYEFLYCTVFGFYTPLSRWMLGFGLPYFILVIHLLQVHYRLQGVLIKDETSKTTVQNLFSFFLTIMISCNWKYYLILRGLILSRILNLAFRSLNFSLLCRY